MALPGWATRTVVAVLLPVPLALSACTLTHRASRSSPATHARPATLALTVTPAAGTQNLPVTTEIGTTVSGGTVSGVTLVDSAGNSVPGAQRPDGSSWVPAAPLGYGQAYRATVTATSPDGRRQTRTTSFTTMPNPGSDRIGTGLYFTSGETYGVGMPIVVEFDTDIPDSAKPAVERRLFVHSDPPQVGVWHWFGDREVQYRPETYWQPGTKLTVRAALGGLPVGGQYIDQDRGGTATIGRKQVFIVRNQTKSMYVYQDDKLVKTFPVSMGKPSTPTSSGNFVIMTHEASTLFDVPGEYRITAYYAERITWDGIYFHAAPWSVADQGHDNVSHGCINLSNSDAKWVYDVAQIGDPVTIAGTEVHLTPGDGWTVWDMSWADYLKGSALPHPDLQASADAMKKLEHLPN